MPETKRLLTNVDGAPETATTTCHVIADLPDLLTRERSAAIRQFMEAVNNETAQMRQLAVELRAALEAGTVTFNSLSTTISRS